MDAEARVLLTAANDGSIRFCRMPSKEVIALEADRPVSALALNPLGEKSDAFLIGDINGRLLTAHRRRGTIELAEHRPPNVTGPVTSISWCGQRVAWVNSAEGVIVSEPDQD